MVTGFVLISAMPGKEQEVHNDLSKVKEIAELHPLFGEYDLMARIEAKDFGELENIILNKIRTVGGVADTKTLVGTKF